VGANKNKNHDIQNIFSLVGLPDFLIVRNPINKIMPEPIRVFIIEKLGMGSMSYGKKKFVSDSGMVRKFSNNGKIPTSPSLLNTPKTWFLVEKSPIALERNQNQNIPDTT